MVFFDSCICFVNNRFYGTLTEQFRRAVGWGVMGALFL